MERYLLKEKLGEGQTGTVYRATPRHGGPDVAVKYISSIGEGYRKKLLLREIQILRELSRLEGSEHITRLVDLIEPEVGLADQDYIFIVTEYTQQSRTLEDVLSLASGNRMRLSEASIWKLITNLVAAVDFLHSVGVIHRDLKPANILVKADLTVKLIDFGLARIDNQSGGCSREAPSTQQGRAALADELLKSRTQRRHPKRKMSSHVITRVYRPPEVALVESYSTKADMWSLGCIIGEIIQCSEPYNSGCQDPIQRILFKATSCYPLSPSFGEPSQASDLLKVQLKVLGDLEAVDLSFISSGRKIKQIINVFQGEPRIRFDLELSKTNPALAGVLTRCLEFNPYMRFSAKQLKRWMSTQFTA